MANFTKNYNIRKPLPEEFYDINEHNANMDIIDTELKKRAVLDENNKVLEEHLPDMNYVPTEEKGKANGVATLDGNSKVPKEQLPEMNYVPTSEKGKVNGIATLDKNGKVPSSQLPETEFTDISNFISKEEKGVAEGVATLDETGKVPKKQLPESGSGKRTVRFTVGSSQYGWTSADCDYLCDGTADEVEINAAIQALRTTGGEIVLLDGLYNLTSAILVNKEGVALIGNGSNTKIIRAFNDNDDDETLQGLILITSAYCTIKNLYIDDVKSNYTAWRTINLYSGTNCIIADNTLVNVGGDGIYVNSDNNTIDNNNVSSSGNSGINLNKTNKSIVTNNKVSESNMYGIFGIRIGDGVINNNICTNNYNSGISLYWADRTTITGNASNNNGDCGFYITRGSGNIICGNTFVGNGAYGVTIQLYASNTVVMSNNFNDNTSGDVYDKGENNTIHLPKHTHDGGDIVSGFDTLANNLGVGRCVTGSYVGTGVSGSDNPCSLTFEFVPKLVFIAISALDMTGTEFPGTMFNVSALTTSYKSNMYDTYHSTSRERMNDDDAYASFVNGNTLRWYWKSLNNPNFQFNILNKTYHWVAIG